MKIGEIIVNEISLINCNEFEYKCNWVAFDHVY